MAYSLSNIIYQYLPKSTGTGTSIFKIIVGSWVVYIFWDTV